MMTEGWEVRICRQRIRPRQIILEGYASLPAEVPAAEEVFLLLVVGPDYLALEVGRELLGERLLDFFTMKMGQPVAPPRIIVGSHEGEEGALSQVEWRFPPSGRSLMIHRLSEILGHLLPSFVSSTSDF